MTRCKYMMIAALMAAAAPMISIAPLARADEVEAQLMFVQTAEDLKADDNCTSVQSRQFE